MAKTVDEAFRTFHGWLTPSDNETAAATSHRTSLYNCLNAHFDLMRFFRTGSFGNGTSVSGCSDVDYFASIPTAKLKQNSGSTLREVRDVLEARFPRTGVRVSTPAVLVPFGSDRSEWTEVVPADYIKKKDDTSVYEIADGSGGWTRSSPEIHNRYVSAVNKQLGYKVKPLIRFVKAWKYHANAPISSFYLELRIAKYAAQETSIVYSIDVKNVFKLLLENELASVIDPKGISGYVRACSSSTNKDDALSKLETAYSRATKARAAERGDKISTAFDWWDKVFFDHFPAYY
jgi:hypothetical protein